MTESETLLAALLIAIFLWIIVEAWIEIRRIRNGNNRDE